MLGLTAGILSAPMALTGASASSLEPASSGVTAAYAVTHPCALLTLGQADAAARVKFGPAQQDPKVLCEYRSNSPSAENATINVYIEMGTVKINLPPKDLGNTYVPEPSVRPGAIWVIEKGAPKGSGELFFWLGFDGKTAYSIQVELAEGGLSEAVKVAKDCVGHLQ